LDEASHCDFLLFILSDYFSVMAWLCYRRMRE
jgi:hypothetical protein